MKGTKMMFPLFCALLATTTASSPWRPVHRPQPSILQQEAAIYDEPSQREYSLDHDSIPSTHPLAQQEEDQCALYKVAMNQQLYFEYIHYKTDVPDMKEFTLCSWTKFTNHSNDHPIFSYAVGDQPRGILVWVANTARSSYFMMNVNGHNLFRLNYPLRLNKWYHACQSWNGRTGEWQIWVNDERVGRGFNNRLVGHVIKGGGVAISGQEQRQLGGGFLEGAEAPEGSGGLLGELTMVQLYGVALSAGKAHKDHKHHHAHHYEHDTSNNTPRPTTPAPVTSRPLPQSPFLTGGQINHAVKINTGTPLQIAQNGLIVRHPNLLQPQTSFQPALPPVNPESQGVPANAFVPSLGSVSLQGSTQYFGNQIPRASQLAQIQAQSDDGFGYIENQYPTIYKRDTNDKTKRETEATDEKVSFVAPEAQDEASPAFGAKVVAKRETDKKKRGLVQLADGSLLDDTFIANQGLDNSYFTGLNSFGVTLPAQANKIDEREPAEGEVRQVMDVCNGCDPDPFEKALIFGWRTVPKKLYSGALYLPAAQTCKGF